MYFRDPDHYYYMAIPEPYAGGPRPDQEKNAFCIEDVCSEVIPNLRPCINYTIDFVAHLTFDETGEMFSYNSVFFVTKPDGIDRLDTKTFLMPHLVCN